jgi:hypothetical protein
MSNDGGDGSSYFSLQSEAVNNSINSNTYRRYLVIRIPFVYDYRFPTNKTAFGATCPTAIIVLP